MGAPIGVVEIHLQLKNAAPPPLCKGGRHPSPHHPPIPLCSATGYEASNIIYLFIYLFINFILFIYLLCSFTSYVFKFLKLFKSQIRSGSIFSCQYTTV